MINSGRTEKLKGGRYDKLNHKKIEIKGIFNYLISE